MNKRKFRIVRNELANTWQVAEVMREEEPGVDRIPIGAKLHYSLTSAEGELAAIKLSLRHYDTVGARDEDCAA